MPVTTFYFHVEGNVLQANPSACFFLSSKLLRFWKLILVLVWTLNFYVFESFYFSVLFIVYFHATGYALLSSIRSCSLLFLPSLKTDHNNIVNQFTYCEDAGTHQQPHETTDFTKQTGDGESVFLPDDLIAQILEQEVHLKEIIPAKYNIQEQKNYCGNQIFAICGDTWTFISVLFNSN